MRQKVAELALNVAIEKLRSAHTAWLKIANSKWYVQHLCSLEDEKNTYGGPGWTLMEEEKSSSYSTYYEGRVAMYDLFYGFMDAKDPLLGHIFKTNEIKDISTSIWKYQPFTLAVLTSLYREQKYDEMLNDLLKIEGVIRSAIAGQ